MTRKDYILIANAFQDQKKLMAQFPLHYSKEQKQAVEDQMAALVRSIAGAIKRDNPNFDRVRFLRACGYGCSQPASLPNGGQEGVVLSAIVSVRHYD
jgi:hypothetical protein